MHISKFDTDISNPGTSVMDFDIYRSRVSRMVRGVSLFLGMLLIGVCEARSQGMPGLPVLNAVNATPVSAAPKGSNMWMTVGERRFAITLAESEAASAFAAQLPLTLDMDELNGNEKHVSLPKALPANADRPGTIRNGDLMLYRTDTLVVFYSTFSSSYSYTRLGRVDHPADLAQALGQRGVRVLFSRN